jgi:hypothetical protein
LFSPEKLSRGGARAAMHWVVGDRVLAEITSSRRRLFRRRRYAGARDKLIFLFPVLS